MDGENFGRFGFVAAGHPERTKNHALLGRRKVGFATFCQRNFDRSTRNKTALPVVTSPKLKASAERTALLSCT